MSFFKKRGPDIIDLTKLRDKGTLQRSRAIAKQNEQELKNSDEVVDLTNFKNSSHSGSSSGSSSSSVSGGFDFLSGLAGAGDSSAKESNISVRGDNVNELKNKIDDLEYKLDRLIERLEKIEGKFG